MIRTSPRIGKAISSRAYWLGRLGHAAAVDRNARFDHPPGRGCGFLPGGCMGGSDRCATSPFQAGRAARHCRDARSRPLVAPLGAVAAPFSRCRSLAGTGTKPTSASICAPRRDRAEAGDEAVIERIGCPTGARHGHGPRSGSARSTLSRRAKRRKARPHRAGRAGVERRRAGIGQARHRCPAGWRVMPPASELPRAEQSRHEQVERAEPQSVTVERMAVGLVQCRNLLGDRAARKQSPGVGQHRRERPHPGGDLGIRGGAGQGL